MEARWLDPGTLDTQRGTALIVTSAVLMVLTWLVPYVAPLAVAAYGLYALVRRQGAEGLAALGVAVALWFLRVPLGWLMWLAGAALAGCGLFFLIRGLRA